MHVLEYWIVPICLMFFALASNHYPLTVIFYITITLFSLRLLLTWFSVSWFMFTSFLLRWIIPISALCVLPWSEQLRLETHDFIVFFSGLQLSIAVLDTFLQAVDLYAEDSGWSFFNWLIPTFLGTLVLLALSDFLELLSL